MISHSARAVLRPKWHGGGPSACEDAPAIATGREERRCQSWLPHGDARARRRGPWEAATRGPLALPVLLLVGLACCLGASLRWREAARASAPGNAMVVVFSRSGCKYCARAKALLQRRGISFGLVDIDAEPQRRVQAAELSGASTLPQIFVGQRCLGGFDDIKLLDEAGELPGALAARANDGPAIPPTPARLLEQGRGVTDEATAAALAPRAEALRALNYAPGSRPRLRAFLRYAVTGRPAQGQEGNVPLNLAAAPGMADPGAALPGASASELAALLRQAMLRLLDIFADAATGDVDYAAMRSSAEWGIFLALGAELGEARLQGDLERMREEERKAFFINLYNAMTFHGIVRYGRRPGLWNLYCFFIAPAVSYNIAGVQVSLDDVEHGLLRAKLGYFAGEGSAPAFLRKLRMASVDPRVHMALNCGARGCPAIAVYSADALEEELDGAAEGFVADDGNVRLVSLGRGEGASELELTELFKMYLQDFVGEKFKEGSQEANQELLRWIVRFARGSKREQLLAALTLGAGPLHVRWLPYDWSTNGPDLPLERHVYRPTW